MAESGDEAAKRWLKTQRPTVSTRLLAFYQAYYDLRSEAPEFSGALTWRSVAAYCRDLGLAHWQMETMFDILRTAQVALQEWESLSQK